MAARSAIRSSGWHNNPFESDVLRAGVRTASAVTGNAQALRYNEWFFCCYQEKNHG